MILIIRGHLRGSLHGGDLYHLVKNIYDIDNSLTVYIHTWNIVSSSLSWRQVTQDDTPVTEEMIYAYFADIKHLIRKIMIDDDKKIKLIGNLEGKINGGNTTILGWKNYWYGKYQIMKYVYDNTDPSIVISIRFDAFNNSNSLHRESVNEFIKNNMHETFTKNKFLKDHECTGVDNFYMGTTETMYALTHKFYYELDDILEKIKDTENQEKFVFRVNDLETF